ncbi:MAG: DUF4388 domain-containing protein [Myxococcales bacterium]|nr:DUF4388 domain-containing protein [Myxococcales bacterium]
MSEPTVPCVLIAADPPRVDELAELLTAEPLARGPIEVLRSTGGDDTIDLVAERRPHVVVVTASLSDGDAGALIGAIREQLPRAEVAVVLLGDAEGPLRTALDAIDIGPDRFVTSPVVPKALRFAVDGAIEQVELARGGTGTTTAGATPEPVAEAEPTAAQHKAAQRARWEALADSMVEVGVQDRLESPLDHDGDADPLPPPADVPKIAPLEAWKPGNTAELRERHVSAPWTAPEPPQREPTLILTGPEPGATPPQAAALPPPPPADPPTRDRDVWGGALPLAELLAPDRGGAMSSSDAAIVVAADADDDLGLGELDADLAIGGGTTRRGVSAPRIEVLSGDSDPGAPLPAIAASAAAEGGRDFARQLRAKMSMMAQRLFQGGDASAAPQEVDLSPRHDHSTEIDLSYLGDEPALERGVTEIEARALQRSGEIRDLTTSPGSWDTQIRERGLPDQGEIVRGISDASMLLAKMFAQATTGKILFRQETIEKVVYFDQGRPVFASSSEPRDRMGGLLVREGKITAAQYERCQAVVAESGRRMGEILVDFGYLKRRELLPAVRRHVEDIVYSLFAWDRGTYHLIPEPSPSSERIRLSRHPAALILEGIRRKLDRTTLEKQIGSASTVIEVPDRERLGGIINLGDLAVEERSALAAFDGQADLAAVARTAGVDVADVLPLACGLCVLGLATARRTDTEVPDESSALVGETDLAIDRERVRARWELVAEADYFALLGVRRDATAFEIRRAYQAARRDFATDSFPVDLRRELAQELDDIANVLDEAFRVLRDDRLRATYLANLVE